MNSLEQTLNDVFVKKAPALPNGVKEWIVKYLPYINLVLGVLSLLAAYNLWHWAHTINRYGDLVNSLSAAYGGSQVVSNRLGFAVWLALIVMIVEAVIYIIAFAPTRDRKKSGWDLLFLALLINVVYGLVMLFSGYNGFGSLVGSVIGTAIGLYFLFQIRAKYLHEKTPTTPHSDSK